MLRQLCVSFPKLMKVMYRALRRPTFLKLVARLGDASQLFWSCVQPKQQVVCAIFSIALSA